MFEHIGYHIEYYLDKKYLGSVKSEKDREVFGYRGRTEIVLESDLKLKKKTIKKGTKVVTELVPLCGKLIK